MVFRVPSTQTMLWFCSISLKHNTATVQRNNIQSTSCWLQQQAIQLEMLLETFTVTDSVLTVTFSLMKKALLHTHHFLLLFVRPQTGRDQNWRSISSSAAQSSNNAVLQSYKAAMCFECSFIPPPSPQLERICGRFVTVPFQVFVSLL